MGLGEASKSAPVMAVCVNVMLKTWTLFRKLWSRIPAKELKEQLLSAT